MHIQTKYTQNCIPIYIYILKQVYGAYKVVHTDTALLKVYINDVPNTLLLDTNLHLLMQDNMKSGARLAHIFSKSVKLICEILLDFCLVEGHMVHLHSEGMLYNTVAVKHDW